MENQTLPNTRKNEREKVFEWKWDDISIPNDDPKELKGLDFIMPTEPETVWETYICYNFFILMNDMVTFRVQARDVEHSLKCQINYVISIGHDEHDMKNISGSLENGSKPYISKVFILAAISKSNKEYFEFFKKLVVKCRFTLIFTSSECNVSLLKTSSENDLNCLSDNLKTLYLSNKLSDFTIIVEDKSFPVHKCILFTRSPVFAAMLENDTVENSENELVIKDFKIKTMEALLLFVYTGQLSELSMDDCFQLYSASHKYALVSLKKILSKKLINFIVLDTVCDVYALGHFHSDVDLKSAATNFMKQNASSVLKSENWRNLLLQNSKIAAQMMDEAGFQ